MAKWRKDALIGWAAVSVTGVVAGLISNAAVLDSTILYMLCMLFVSMLAVPGAVLLGRNRAGWILPGMGGFISAGILWTIISLTTKNV